MLDLEGFCNIFAVENVKKNYFVCLFIMGLKLSLLPSRFFFLKLCIYTYFFGGSCRGSAFSWMSLPTRGLKCLSPPPILFPTLPIQYTGDRLQLVFFHKILTNQQCSLVISEEFNDKIRRGYSPSIPRKCHLLYSIYIAYVHSSSTQFTMDIFREQAAKAEASVGGV